MALGKAMRQCMHRQLHATRSGSASVMVVVVVQVVQIGDAPGRRARRSQLTTPPPCPLAAIAGDCQAQAAGHECI